MVYTPDQFSTNATSAQQMQQYPLTYPVGYPYTYNGTTYQGYWGQPMTTYYVPQSQLSSAPTPVSTPVIVPPTTSNPHGNSSNNSISNSKRGSPPNSTQAQFSNANHSAGVPIPLSDPSGATTMYAIPPLYPGMLPYTTPPTGVISHQLQHPPNSVINSVVPPSPQLQIEQPSYHQINTTNSTPQSAPSTPLSLPLPLPHSKNTPLFATPSIVPSGFTQQIGSIPLQNGENNFDRKTINPNRRTNFINNSTNRQSTNTATTTSFVTQNHQTFTYNPSKKPFEPAASRANTVQTKRTDSYKQPTPVVSTTSLQNSCNTVNHVNNQINNNNGEKHRVTRPKPSNLDLRRSNSNRNTPSTNSAESNNSPNSITSTEQPPIYMTRAPGATHLSQIHAQTSHIDPCHQQLISTYNPGMYVKFGQTYFTHVRILFSLLQILYVFQLILIFPM